MKSISESILEVLLDRGVTPLTKASRAAIILAEDGITVINVRTAFRLGHGLTWDRVSSALQQAQREINEANATANKLFADQERSNQLRSELGLD